MPIAECQLFRLAYCLFLQIQIEGMPIATTIGEQLGWCAIETVVDKVVRLYGCITAHRTLLGDIFAFAH
jgi:hypothetical protein